MVTTTPAVALHLPARDNQSVQNLLGEAISVLKGMALPEDDINVMKRNLLVNYLELFKAYSASSNSIAGLGGLGLEQGMEIAQNIVDGKFKDGFRLNFKHLGKGFLEI